MSFDRLLSRIRSQPQATRAALEWLLEEAGGAQGQALAGRLRQIAGWTESSAVTLHALEGGAWRVLGRAGAVRPVPAPLLADALDRAELQAADGWLAAWVQLDADRQSVLAVQLDQPGPFQRLLVDGLAAALGASLEVAAQRRRLLARLRRAETMVRLASQWNQHRETGALLHAMATAATELFQAERASIFLWDRTARQLVGRPALGVEGGELRVAEDRGVVGHVVRTGQPLVVDPEEADRWIDRRVDQQLQFRTRSVACVPLKNEKGTVIGAFELLNRQGGRFTADDAEGLAELAEHAAVAIENSQEFERLVRSRRQMADEAAAGVQLIGQSPSIVQLRETIQRVAPTDLVVLITGENGSGKEVVSRLIHYGSRRRDHPFVAVNCAALTETLLESELFGHERGAFTDAVDARAGKFELATGGTLFLDEIGDMSPGGQAKLLRVLEEKVVVRVGGGTPIRIDTRVLAATNQDLAELVRQKRFRQDLFFRLNVVPLHLAPLRERLEDVELLAEHFLKTFAAQARRPVPRLSPAARRRLRQHTWPGNVRELRNWMERLAYLAPGETIEGDDLQFALTPAPAAAGEEIGGSLAEATRAFQIGYIRRQLDAAGGNVTEAARRLGLHRTNLYRKMRQLRMTEGEADG